MSQVHLHCYDSGGPGRPIVMIHGFPLSHQSFKHQFTDFIKAGLRVVAYDRRGFGESEKPETGYDYNTLADDLSSLIHQLQLRDAVLLGFSMGGGEVARYIGRHSQNNIGALVFASAVTPYLAKSDENPDGPLDEHTAKEKLESLQKDRDAYFKSFLTKFYSVNGALVVDQSEVDAAFELCRQADQHAAEECMKSFSTTDFRDDLTKIDLPTLVIHGDSDAVVPFNGSGYRTFKLLSSAQLNLIQGGPHGVNVSHAAEFNQGVIDFVKLIA